MKKNVIVSLADSNYFPLLNELIESIKRFKNLSAEQDEETIKSLSQQIIKLGRKPRLDETDQKIEMLIYF